MNALINNTTVFYLAAIVFRLLLDASYVLFVSIEFNYHGYLLDISLINYIGSWLFYLLSFIFVKDKIIKVSDYFFIVFLFALYAPLTSIYGCDNGRVVYPVVMALLSMFIVYLVVKIKIFSFRGLPILQGGKNIAVLVSLSFVVFLVMWYYVSGVELNFDLLKVYEYREINAEISAAGFFSYTNIWTFKVFNIFLMALCLHKRKYVYFIVLFFVQIYFFSASTHKIVLFLPFLLVGIWYYFRKTNHVSVVPVVLCFLMIVALMSYLVFEDIIMSSFLSRRTFFVPAKLTYDYFNFFSNNEKVFWSNSLFSGLINYPYEESVAKTVGEFIETNAHANNGYIAMGYAHAGYLGVVFYSILVGFVLRFINDITYNAMPLWLAVALSMVPLRGLIVTSDFFTVMLTHGLIVSLILIYLARTKHEKT